MAEVVEHPTRGAVTTNDEACAFMPMSEARPKSIPWGTTWARRAEAIPGLEEWRQVVGVNPRGETHGTTCSLKGSPGRSGVL